MTLKIIQLTKEQQAELQDAQDEITRMFVANPRKPGVILAQVIPPAGEMRVRVLDHALVSKLAEFLPAHWPDEVLALLTEHQKPTVVGEKTGRLAEVIEEARFGISGRADEIAPGVLTRWLAYIEEEAPPCT